MVEGQHCAIEFCVRFEKCGSETLQLIRQDYEDDAMRRAAVFKWWMRCRDRETNVKGQNRLFHYPLEACGKRSAACFREVGGALQEVHRLPREVLRKGDRHRTSTNFRLGVLM
jgi:hypothetical protein